MLTFRVLRSDVFEKFRRLTQSRASAPSPASGKLARDRSLAPDVWWAHRPADIATKAACRRTEMPAHSLPKMAACRLSRVTFV
jgi:hypothetical protein